MFKALILAISVALLPQALAVCSPGELAIGITTTGPSNAVSKQPILFVIYTI